MKTEVRMLHWAVYTIQRPRWCIRLLYTIHLVGIYRVFDTQRQARASIAARPDWLMDPRQRQSETQGGVVYCSILVIL